MSSGLNVLCHLFFSTRSKFENTLGKSFDFHEFAFRRLASFSSGAGASLPRPVSSGRWVSECCGRREGKEIVVEVRGEKRGGIEVGRGEMGRGERGEGEEKMGQGKRGEWEESGAALWKDAVCDIHGSHATRHLHNARANAQLRLKACSIHVQRHTLQVEDRT